MCMYYIQTINSGDNVEKREPSYTLLWKCKLVQLLWRAIWRFLKTLKIEPTYDPAIPFLGIYLEKTTIQKDPCISVFIGELFSIARTQTQPKCPSAEEWIKKMWYIYTTEYYCHNKREIMPFSATQMDLEIIMLSEVNQAEKDKYHMISFI